jgi:hypothetical protein
MSHLFVGWVKGRKARTQHLSPIPVGSASLDPTYKTETPRRLKACGYFTHNKINAVTRTLTNPIGRNTFQPRCINWSNRYLGNVALTQIKINRRK